MDEDMCPWGDELEGWDLPYPRVCGHLEVMFKQKHEDQKSVCEGKRQ